MMTPRPWAAYLAGPEWAGLSMWVEQEMEKAAGACKPPTARN
jgi:hypothetical protein